MRTVLGLGVAAMVLGGVSADAHAETVSDRVYNDVRDVIEELITRQVSESVVPAVACRAERLMTWYPRSLQTVYDRRFGALRDALTDETVELAANKVFALLQKTEAPTTNESGPALKVVPKSNGTVSDVPTVGGGKTDAAVEACIATRSAEFKQQAHLSPKLHPLDEECAKSSLSLSTHYSCEVAFAVRATLRNKAALAQDHLLRAVSAVVTAFIAREGGLEIKEQTKVWDEVTIALRELTNGSAKTDPIHEISVAVAEVLSGTSPPDEGVVRAWESRLMDLGVAMRRLRTQWRVAVVDGHVDVTEFLDVVVGATSAVASICSGKTPPEVCKQVDASSVFRIGGSYASLAHAVGARDYKEIATTAVRTFFPIRDNCGANVDCDKTNIYARFTENVVLYVLELAENGEATIGTRTAFKSAAVDVIHESESRSGVGLDRPWLEKLIVPDLVLRYGWSSSFLNESSGDGSRAYASIDVVNFRTPIRHSPYAYVATQVSFLDLLGGVSEIALRRNADYEKVGSTWYAMLHPRLELLYGAPALSKKLVLSVGVGLRGAIPYIRSNGTAVYTRLFSNDTGEDPHNYGMRFLDFGIGVRYTL